MECSRCSQVPDLHFGACIVYLGLPTNHHLAGMMEYVTDKGYLWHLEEEHLVIQVADFRAFMLELQAIITTELEQKDTLILPLLSGETMSFGLMRGMKTMERWLKCMRYEELMEVLKARRVKVLFQPIVNALGGEIYGYEALIRGVDANGQLVSPLKLFAMARELDLLFNLDRLCRETIIERASELDLKQKLFINFIPTAIYDPYKCLSTTDKAVRTSTLVRSQIIFEVVESEFVEDYTHLNGILDYYRERGYETALDDLGSGYSDENMMGALKPNYIKIDQTIIRHIHHDIEKQNRLYHYMALAHEQACKVLAEGVETKEEADFLIHAGVDFLQGYYYGKPQEGLITP